MTIVSTTRNRIGAASLVDPITLAVFIVGLGVLSMSAIGMEASVYSAPFSQSVSSASSAY